MPKQEKSPHITAILSSGMLVVAVLFTYFGPLRITTDHQLSMPLELDEIHGIIPQSGNSFLVEYLDGRTIVVKENLQRFKQRAAFTRHSVDKLVLDEKAQVKPDNRPIIKDPEVYPCNPIVGKYNVFFVKGFVYIDAQTFIVIDNKRDYKDCPCNNPKVIRGTEPNCPHIYYNTKKKIMERARECGLGDWFPIERCSS